MENTNNGKKFTVPNVLLTNFFEHISKAASIFEDRLQVAEFHVHIYIYIHFCRPKFFLVPLGRKWGLDPIYRFKACSREVEGIFSPPPASLHKLQFQSFIYFISF